ncbi:GNAT family N-acetyltransferase [Nocardioides endophyticus]|uniref:GNAT family N-acetyltransferase n=1 Tax=Nocardioides endophyticus TaxID=1353775 RepID=A0ABP8YYA5_9ACTN
MVTVSTDVTRLDVDTVHRWLSTDAYWAIGRPREVVERAVAGSLNFGAYDGDQLVGYARVVTDHATFAWLCDVYVDPGARGSGVGTALVSAVDAELTDLGVRRAVLATADAHELYARFGFEPMSQPERWMLRTYLP